jgi:hypothetical protein
MSSTTTTLFTVLKEKLPNPDLIASYFYPIDDADLENQILNVMNSTSENCFTVTTDPKCLLYYGIIHELNKKHEDAIKYYKLSYENGLIEGLHFLGRLYQLKEDFENMYACYIICIGRQHIPSMFNLTNYCIVNFNKISCSNKTPTGCGLTKEELLQRIIEYGDMCIKCGCSEMFERLIIFYRKHKGFESMKRVYDLQIAEELKSNKFETLTKLVQREVFIYAGFDDPKYIDLAISLQLPCGYLEKIKKNNKTKLCCDVIIQNAIALNNPELNSKLVSELSKLPWVDKKWLYQHLKDNTLLSQIIGELDHLSKNPDDITYIQLGLAENLPIAYKKCFDILQTDENSEALKPVVYEALDKRNSDINLVIKHNSKLNHVVFLYLIEKGLMAVSDAVNESMMKGRESMMKGNEALLTLPNVSVDSDFEYYYREFPAIFELYYDNQLFINFEECPICLNENICIPFDTVNCPTHVVCVSCYSNKDLQKCPMCRHVKPKLARRVIEDVID